MKCGVSVVLSFLLVALFSAFAQAVLIVDASEPVSVDQFRCLANSGVTEAIIRCYHSYGAPDVNAPQTVANAWAAGYSNVGVYMFPCPKCGNPVQQVADAVQYLSDHKVNFTTYWLDIEGGPLYWNNDTAANREFFTGLVAGAQAHDLTIGVYTSASQWIPIFGDSYISGSAFPLWYAHYETPENPSFSDFKPFAGWERPFAKQYADHGPCNVDVDMSWRP